MNRMVIAIVTILGVTAAAGALSGCSVGMAASGKPDPLDLGVLAGKGSLFVTRPSLGAYALTREEILWRCADLFEWIRAGKLNVRIDRVFELKDTAQAHAYLEGRNTKGKVLIAIGG